MPRHPFHRLRLAPLAVALALTTAGCLIAPVQDPITQVGTIDALKAGRYDGTTPVGELDAWGDTGLGTFDRLDGEMVVVDGVVYRVDDAGQVHVAPPRTRTPFAAVTRFHPDQTVPLEAGTEWDQIQSLMVGMIDTPPTPPTPPTPHAVRIRGRFASVTCRSVPAQNPPYPPLADVIAQQTVFKTGPVTGTAVGFWFPAELGTLQPPGLHLHFLSDDRDFGGHVLGLTVDEATVELDRATGIGLLFPPASAPQ